MTTYPLRRYSKKSPWYPILVLETWISRNFRKKIINLTTAFGVVLAGFYCFDFLIALPFFVSYIELSVPVFISYVLSDFFLGIFFLLLALSAWCIALEAYYRSFYFDDISGKRTVDHTLFSFEVAWILHTGKNVDPLISFLDSVYGEKVMRRLGIGADPIANFINERISSQKLISIPELPINSSDEITLPEFVGMLSVNNEDFLQFLAEYNTNQAELVGAADWVVWKQEVVDRRQRWWSLENLSQIPTIGASWGYGHTPFLDLYSNDLFDDPALYLSRFRLGSRDREVSQLETILSRQEEANALLVAETGTTKMDVVYELVSKIKNGKTVMALKNRRPVLFQVSVFLAGCKTKTDFETSFLNLLNQTTKAGNILLVVDDLANLITGAKSLEVNLPALVDPYLKSSLIQVVALANTESFYQVVNPMTVLLNRFEKIEIQNLGSEDLVRLLQVKLLDFEYKTGIRLTYPALLSIIELADSYFSDGALQDKSVDLLIELLSVYGSRNNKDIAKKDVYDYIRNKTNIPIGEINVEEKEKLINIEKNIGRRVIGQEEAVKAISSAMRRVRTSIRDTKRPIGSFMFLGPTGVGKTETAKALAENFFGSETAMNRLDMSEYQGPDSMERLLGSFTDSKPGVFTTMMRQRPYGVLLLDEFEKANRDVHSLFLQILDEGFFSDMAGKRINVRNTIIIATSNAGSDYIWEKHNTGELSQEKNNIFRDSLVDHIVKKGIYRPELLNRFDSVVVFRPLTKPELVKIALIMVNKLAKRLKTQGLTLEVTEELAMFVAENGSNEVFGARPMQRFIQDSLEDLIARKLIDGSLGRGMSIKIFKTVDGSLEVKQIV